MTAAEAKAVVARVEARVEQHEATSERLYEEASKAAHDGLWGMHGRLLNRANEERAQGASLRDMLAPVEAGV